LAQERFSFYYSGKAEKLGIFLSAMDVTVEVTKPGSCGTHGGNTCPSVPEEPFSILSDDTVKRYTCASLV
jgi:hypothetical protein